MIAVMTQYIGAKKIGVAYQARQLGAVFNALLGIFLSVFLFSFSENILEIVGVAPLLMDYAKTYLKIVGGFCFLTLKSLLCYKVQFLEQKENLLL
mgnify:CR=1 FL=1